MNVDTGLPPVGCVDWGTHFCHFFRDETDIAETLVPYFKTGLEANDACLWITAEPFPKEAAINQLRVYFDDLESRISNGQLTVLDQAEWYERVGNSSGAEVVDMWAKAESGAKSRGHAGLRLSGNISFVRAEDWDAFNAYEKAVGDAFASQQILALCSYPIDRCDASAVLDLVRTHDFALAKRGSRWELTENTSVRRSRAAMQTLSDALAQQQILTAELTHRVKNSIASVQAIVDQSLRRASSPTEARASVSGRLTALARAHEQLSAREWASASLKDIVKSAAAAFGTKVHVDLGEEILTARAALNLSLVFHELMTNAVKYGSLRQDGGSVSIRSSHTCASEPYTISWIERGGPTVRAPTRKGFGTTLAERLITHDLRGECEFAFDPDGLRCTMIIPSAELLVRRTTCIHGCAH